MRVGSDGDLTDREPQLEGSRRRMDMVGRKTKQPSESERRRGFLPDSGNWVRDQGEKAKGRTSVERKVPSSRAFLDETLWLTTVGCDG